MLHSTVWFCVVLFVCYYCGWFCFWFGFSFLFVLVCGMKSYGSAPRIHGACHSSALLAVISTASKHLHNDVARAIEVLEQKKPPWGTHGWLGVATINHHSVMGLLGRPIFARLLFLTFSGPKTGPFFVILFCSNFHSLEALRLVLRPSLWTPAAA